MMSKQSNGFEIEYLDETETGLYIDFNSDRALIFLFEGGAPTSLPLKVASKGFISIISETYATLKDEGFITPKELNDGLL